MFMLWQLMLRDTSVEEKQCDLGHVGISMNSGKTQEVRFPSRVSVVYGCIVLLLGATF